MQLFVFSSFFLGRASHSVLLIIHRDSSGRPDRLIQDSTDHHHPSTVLSLSLVLPSSLPCERVSRPFSSANAVSPKPFARALQNRVPPERIAVGCARMILGRQAIHGVSEGVDRGNDSRTSRMSDTADVPMAYAQSHLEDFGPISPHLER